MPENSTNAIAKFQLFKISLDLCVVDANLKTLYRSACYQKGTADADGILGGDEVLLSSLIGIVQGIISEVDYLAHQMGGDRHE